MIRRNTIVSEQITERAEEEKSRAHQRTLYAIGAFGALVTLTIALLSARNYFPANYYPLIFILLLIMVLVLIAGFWGNSISLIVSEFFKKRRYNKLAKSNFEEFKKLVIRFGDLTENRPDNIQMIMNNIKRTPPFSQITGVEPLRIQDLYKYYNKRFNQFDGTGNNLIDLIKDFESILYIYYEVYIKEPIKTVKIIGSDNVNKLDIESYNKAQTKYTAFLMDYNAFAKTANEDFKENLAFGGNRFKDTFEPPEDL